MMAEAIRGLSARLGKVSGLLAGRFGRPEICAHETEPVRNLILTILSQNTTDANRDRAYALLAERFPTISALAAARQSELEEAIRVAGLARAKAKAILGALARIREERGGYSLDFLREDAATRGESVPHLFSRGRGEDGEHSAPVLLRYARIPRGHPCPAGDEASRACPRHVGPGEGRPLPRAARGNRRPWAAAPQPHPPRAGSVPPPQPALRGMPAADGLPGGETQYGR